MNRARFWDLINTLCDEFAGSVTSGYRSARRNHFVGGALNSRHLKGFAADLVLDDWTVKIKCIKTAEKLGLRVIDETQTRNHLHIDVDPAAAEGE